MHPSLRESSLFAGIWLKAVSQVKADVGCVDQKSCVARVIPLAQKLWSALEQELRTGTCAFPEAIRLFGQMDRKREGYVHLPREVEWLNGATPKKERSSWYSTFFGRIEELRKVERLTHFVPAILKLHEYLSGFVFSTQNDATLQTFRDAARALEQVAAWTLLDLAKCRSWLPLIELTPFLTQDFLIAFTRKREMTRVRLVRQCTDDQRLLNGLLQLSELRTSIDGLLFSNVFPSLQAFFAKLNTCVVSVDQIKAVEIVLASFDGIQDLLVRNTENAGVKAWKDVLQMMQHGRFVVQGTNEERLQLTCHSGGEVVDFEQLVDLRKQLLMTDVGEDLEVDGVRVKSVVEAFVEKIRVLEDIRNAVAALHRHGHFCYADAVACEIAPAEPMGVYRDLLANLEREHRAWQETVRALRAEYYFFNYFLVSQLRIVRDDMVLLASGDDTPWGRRWAGVTSRIVGPLVDTATVHQVRASMRTARIDGQSPEEQLRAIAMLLEETYAPCVPKFRACTFMREANTKRHQGDLIISAASGVRASIFICVCDDAQVLDAVLTIYLRRDRLPQPEELLICDDTTTCEEMELMLHRFARAAQFHRKDYIFCIAHVQRLPYAAQCAAVELLRSLPREGGASLVLVSGDSNQYLLTSCVARCHAHQISVPVLPRDVLRQALSDASPMVSALISDINGAGKTTEILTMAYDLQRAAPAYHRVSLRENACAGDLLAQLCRAPRLALIHLDLGDVPRTLHALLFDLLCIGTVADPKTLTVFCRTADTRLVVEVPNMAHTVADLSAILFLPPTRLEMKAERLRFTLPRLKCDGMVEMVENVPMLQTAKWIRAIQSGRFLPNAVAPSTFTPNWDQTVLLAEPITQREVWDILCDRCCNEEGTQPPSFLVFSHFSCFMHEQFLRVMQFPLLSLHVTYNIAGLPRLRHSFCRLLVETSQAFSLRQVPKTNVRAVEIPQCDAALHCIDRFHQMTSWESTDHPVTLFKYELGNVVGIDLIALHPQVLLERYLSRDLVKALNDNRINVSRDWSKVSTEQAISLIRFCKGLPPLADHHPLLQQRTMGHTSYVVTIDNLLKIVSIVLRLEYGLPVIMMGETGCGKTALIQFIAQTLEFPMRLLDVHGGITEADMLTFMQQCIEEANRDPTRTLLVFLDEINAGNVLGLCKMMIVDRMLEGRPLPPNVRMVACCNPYRARSTEEGGLVYANRTKQLVYRVHPLPESLIDLVSDFGGISSNTEALYIRAMLFRELKGSMSWFTEFVEMFTALIGRSQEYTREVHNHERSVVSLRDIARAARVFDWFLEKYPGINTSPPLDAYRMATLLTLGYCYYSRLNRQHREGYLASMCTVWTQTASASLRTAEWCRTFDRAADCEKELIDLQCCMVRPMALGEGIALNEALRENLFMFLVSVMNQIPIFVIGKPGCSKSLAVEILQRNLNGCASENAFKSMPALHIMPYQCSPLSTANGIRHQFNNARKYAGDTSRTIVCVLLDEVGLAEESPHLPLKVLHKELEQMRDGIACIGISNWSLDAAKMSRAVTLFRAPPTVDDLCRTAEDMVSNHVLRAYLRALSEGFYQVYQTQRRPDFWGLREFYSLVRVLHKVLARQNCGLDADTLMNTVLRNFGGRSSAEVEDIITTFFHKCGMRKEEAHRVDVADLVRQNLAEPDARHLMLLTQNNSALRLLFDLKHTISTFP